MVFDNVTRFRIYYFIIIQKKSIFAVNIFYGII